MLAAPAAHMDSELVLQGRQAALQCADDASGDAGRMPVHTHDGAEGLEPEGMRQPPQELVATIVVDDRLANNGAQRGHARCQPRRYAPAMKGKISAACSSCHCVSFDSGTHFNRRDGAPPTSRPRSPADPTTASD